MIWVIKSKPAPEPCSEISQRRVTVTSRQVKPRVKYKAMRRGEVAPNYN